VVAAVGGGDREAAAVKRKITLNFAVMQGGYEILKICDSMIVVSRHIAAR
jgi:hypothetical protein